MLSGCYGVIKYLMVLINFLFWLCGFAIVIVAIWMLTDPTFYLSMAQDKDHYDISLYIFLGFGLLMLVIAFLGCCGAFKESQCMLISFFSFLLIILVAEVAACIWAYTNADGLEIKLRKAVKTTVQEEYGQIVPRTQTFDVIQKQLQCCGADGPSDWNNSRFNKDKPQGSKLSLQVSSHAQNYSIPKSCCREGTEGQACDKATNPGIGGTISNDIYTQGCIDKFVEAIKSYFTVVMGVTIGVVAIQVLGIIFSLVLCFAINRTDRYKA